MPTRTEVIKQLDQDELDYPALAKKFGPSVLPVLLKIVADDNPGRAAKATYLASLIAGPEQEAVITTAAQSDEATVRVAAAGAVKNMKSIPLDALDSMLGDADDGVRRLAARSAGESKVKAVRDRLKDIASGDPVVEVREAAAKAVSALR